MPSIDSSANRLLSQPEEWPCARRLRGTASATAPAGRARKRAPAGLLVHSDQGNQYSATRCKDLLARHGAQQSRRRRGNCYDNAESFWGRFRAKPLDGGRFPGLAEAKLGIRHHAACYDAERRHSALGYLAPNHFKT